MEENHFFNHIKGTPRISGVITSNKPKGFTLIELLVVISIIALLLSILMPALRKAKLQAIQVKCANNLRQLSIAVHCYASDNNGEVMGSVIYPPVFTDVVPDRIWFQTASSVTASQWNLRNINNYIEVASFKNNIVTTSVLICPNLDQKYFLDYMQIVMKSLAKPPSQPRDVDFMSGYSYYARVDQWTSNCRNGAERELVGKELSSKRILITDMFSLGPDATSKLRYIYNHGKYGGTASYGYNMSLDYDRIPNINGLNQLYGDGRVEWKSAKKFNFTNMYRYQSSRYLGGYVENWGHAQFYATPSAFNKQAKNRP